MPAAGLSSRVALPSRIRTGGRGAAGSRRVHADPLAADEAAFASNHVQCVGGIQRESPRTDEEGAGPEDGAQRRRVPLRRVGEDRYGSQVVHGSAPVGDVDRPIASDGHAIRAAEAGGGAGDGVDRSGIAVGIGRKDEDAADRDSVRVAAAVVAEVEVVGVKPCLVRTGSPRLTVCLGWCDGDLAVCVGAVDQDLLVEQDVQGSRLACDVDDVRRRGVGVDDLFRAGTGTVARCPGRRTGRRPAA